MQMAGSTRITVYVPHEKAQAIEDIVNEDDDYDSVSEFGRAAIEHFAEAEA